jgi:hypothetical protein
MRGEVLHQGPDEPADVVVAHVVVTIDDIPCIDQENLSRCAIELGRGSLNFCCLARREGLAVARRGTFKCPRIADHDVEKPGKTQGLVVGAGVGKDRAAGGVIGERRAFNVGPVMLDRRVEPRSGKGPLESDNEVWACVSAMAGRNDAVKGVHDTTLAPKL